MQVVTPVCGQEPVIPLQADKSPVQTVLVNFPNTFPLNGATPRCVDRQV